VVRLGGLRWGAEIYGVGHATEKELQQREFDLCLGLADILEGLLGTVTSAGESEDGDGEGGEQVVGEAEAKRHAGSGASLKLSNILAWLRLPVQSRKGVTLKDLLRHQLFAPLRPTSIDSEVPSAWKVFIDQGQ
ncbi:unnamed protein product, partial [Hapterophycus canaliculatus]